MAHWIDALASLQRADAFRFETDKSTYLRLFPEALPRGCAYKIVADERFKRFTLSIVLRNSAALQDDAVIKTLRTIADQNGGTPIREKTWFAIKLPPIARGLVNARTAEVMDATLPALVRLLGAAAPASAIR